jgi:iron complex outermembrane recepter protein
VVRGLSLGAAMAYASSIYARGDENNLDRNGQVPGYATVQLEAGWVIVPGLRASLRVENLLGTRPASFAVLGQNAFTGPDRTFGPAVGSPVVPEQFRSVAAPRGAWLTLEYRFGGGAAQAGGS